MTDASAECTIKWARARITRTSAFRLCEWCTRVAAWLWLLRCCQSAAASRHHQQFRIPSARWWVHTSMSSNAETARGRWLGLSDVFKIWCILIYLYYFALLLVNQKIPPQQQDLLGQVGKKSRDGKSHHVSNPGYCKALPPPCNINIRTQDQVSCEKHHKNILPEIEWNGEPMLSPPGCPCFK